MIPPRRRVISAVLLAATALWSAAVVARTGAPAFAQPDETAAVIRDAHKFVLQYALRAPDPGRLLQRAVAAARQAGAAGAEPPAPGSAVEENVAAAASFIATVLGGLPAPQHEPALAAVLRAMVSELGDPHAAVFAPGEFRRFQEGLRGERGSIGAQIDVGPAGTIVVSDVTPGGPAARAGMLPGDGIEEIEGRSPLFLSPDEVLRLLRGPPGTPAAIITRRGTTARHLTLIRAVVRENATRARVIESRLGYLRLLEFSRLSSQDLSRAVAALRRGGAEILLLDLRGNPGGLVDEAVEVASVFLGDGVVAFEERRAGPDPLHVRPATRFPGPVVLLADGASASASEIVAGALQDAGAPLVGTSTYGKTTVQSVTIPALPGGWGLRITSARYLTRTGRNIEGTGLAPTIRVPMDPRLIQTPGDAQYREALTLARARLIPPSGP